VQFLTDKVPRISTIPQTYSSLNIRGACAHWHWWSCFK